MRKLTIALPYYENPGMLERHFAALEALPEQLRVQLRLIVVDDGSPRFPAVARPCGVDVEIYRITVDVRWNQDAARNLGVHHAPDGWVLMTDIDHLIPTSTLEALVYGGLDEATIYRFSRVSEPDMAGYKPHPNSWLMTKAMFERTGGYDERFAGFYGTDADYRDRVVQAAPVVVLPNFLVRVPREVTPDASTTAYQRKQPEDQAAIPEIKRERARDPNWRPKRLTFPFVRVA